VTGLAFDHLCIVGMTERSFPAPVDPFLPVGEPPADARWEWQSAGERLALRTAVVTAHGGALTLSSPDSIGGRKVFPSR
jgi:hypothetical protein